MFQPSSQSQICAHHSWFRFTKSPGSAGCMPSQPAAGASSVGRKPSSSDVVWEKDPEKLWFWHRRTWALLLLGQERGCGQCPGTVEISWQMPYVQPGQVVTSVECDGPSQFPVGARKGVSSEFWESISAERRWHLFPPQPPGNLEISNSSAFGHFREYRISPRV